MGGVRGALLLTLIAALTYFAAVAFLHLALMCFDDIPATASCAEVAPSYPVSFTLVHTYITYLLPRAFPLELSL